MARLRALSRVQGISVMRGFVLLIMLVYTQVFSLLAVHGTASLLARQQLLREHLTLADRQSRALAVLARIDRMAESSCLVTIQQYSSLAQHSSGWWRLHACRMQTGGDEYFFVREFLGADSCSSMRNAKNQLVMAHYYRNTLHQQSAAGTPLLVQDTIARPGKSPPVCDTLRQIKPGRQMLRWL